MANHSLLHRQAAIVLHDDAVAHALPVLRAHLRQAHFFFGTLELLGEVLLGDVGAQRGVFLREPPQDVVLKASLPHLHRSLHGAGLCNSARLPLRPLHRRKFVAPRRHCGRPRRSLLSARELSALFQLVLLYALLHEGDVSASAPRLIDSGTRCSVPCHTLPRKVLPGRQPHVLPASLSMLSPDLRQEPRGCHPLNIRGWVLDCFAQ